MTMKKNWAKQILEFGNKSIYKAGDLYTAEKKAFAAHQARVQEMKKPCGLGVLPHDGNNQKMIITSVLSLLSVGDERGFRTELDNYRDKACRDPLNFSPISHGLTSAEGSLGNCKPNRPRAISKAAEVQNIFTLLTASY
jgi:hypothetical protein